MTVTRRMCVIGLGPRGLSVLERICAGAADTVPAGTVLEVHVVDPHLHAGGLVWRRNQDPNLLMNTVTSQVSMFVDDSVECEGPVVAGPSLYEWSRFISILSIIATPHAIPGYVRAEASRLGPNSYPSRSFYGHYLAWTLQHLIKTAPRNVRIEAHPVAAVDLDDVYDGTQTVHLADGTRVTGLGSVVMTVGHLPNRPSPEEVATARAAEGAGHRYVPPGNPADQRLDAVAPGEPTLLRGMGLNFFDHMALFTTGRGGEFVRDGDGPLTYRPSGREPRLITGSRRGMPYHSRGENQKGPFGRHVPLLLGPATIARLRDSAPVDFRDDVWPLVDVEVRAVYYGTLVRARAGEAAEREFVDAFVRAADLSPSGAEPMDRPLTPAQERLLEFHGVEERWDWNLIARPYSDQDFGTTADFRAWLREHLVEDVRQARLGNVDGALKAALDVLRDLRNEIRLVVDHGGLWGDSYRDDLQRWYTPLNAYLSIGPPVQRVEEMVALIDAGVLTVLGPDLRVEHGPDGFRAWSAMLPDVHEVVTTLIEARLPEPDLRCTEDPLVGNLVRRGAVRLYAMPQRSGGVYETGGLSVTARPYHVVRADGGVHPRRFAFGVPTETVHWVTAAGPRPGVNSMIFADADAVARAGIAAAVGHDALPAERAVVR